MAKAVAQLRGRDFVVPKDVQEVFGLTVAHRLLLSNQAEGMGMTASAVLKQLLGQVPAPKLH
jgi:MoxR-like ATPase